MKLFDKIKSGTATHPKGWGTRWAGFYKITTLMKYKIAILLVIATISCTPNITEAPGLQGSIYNWSIVTTIFNANSGRIVEKKWNLNNFCPNLICQGPSDTFIVTETRDYYNRHETIAENVERSYKLFYKYDVESSDLLLIDSLKNKEIHCYSLDYLPQENKYLFWGKYYGKSGLFLFDADFNLLKVNDRIPTDIRFSYIKAISEDIVLLCDRSILWIVGFDKNRKPLIHNVERFLDISNDQSKIIYETDNEVYIYDILKNQKTHLKEISDIGSACFSPDGKYIAFHMFTDMALFDSMRLCILNIENKHIYYTKVISKPRGIIWIE